MEKISTERLGQQLRKDCEICLSRVKRKAEGEVCCCEGRTRSPSGPPVEVQTPSVLVTVLIIEVQSEKCLSEEEFEES